MVGERAGMVIGVGILFYPWFENRSGLICFFRAFTPKNKGQSVEALAKIRAADYCAWHDRTS
jgi:hypothetical protein